MKKELDATTFRLLGIGFNDLRSNERANSPDLVDTGATRRAKAEIAMDLLRNKIGLKAVETGYTFGKTGLGCPQAPAQKMSDAK